MGLDEVGQVLRWWGGEGFGSFFGFEVYPRAVECLTVQEEFFQEGRGHSLFHEPEHQSGVGAVEFVSH